jgi:hypothetical protein
MNNTPKTLKVKEEVKYKEWNKHLPEPLEPESIVQIHPDQSNVEKGYVRIIKNNGFVAIFNENYFEEL